MPESAMTLICSFAGWDGVFDGFADAQNFLFAKRRVNRKRDYLAEEFGGNGKIIRNVFVLLAVVGVHVKRHVVDACADLGLLEAVNEVIPRNARLFSIKTRNIKMPGMFAVWHFPRKRQAGNPGKMS